MGRMYIVTAYRIKLASKAVKTVACITDFGVSTAIITFLVVERWALAWELQTLIQTYKKVYFSSCLVFFSKTTAHRLKKNSFPCRNLNHSNLLFLIEIAFSSPDLNCYLCWIFRKFLRNIFGGALCSKKLRLYIQKLPKH